MRQLVTEAFSQAQGLVDRAIDETMAENRPGEKDLAQRYVALHRGNPLAMAQFVAQSAPRGKNPLTEMRRYEQRMEELVRKYGLGRTPGRR